MFPFHKGWYTAGHGELWNCNSTYCFVPYERLPVLDAEKFQGTFQWLIDLEDEFEDDLSPEAQINLATNLNRLLKVTEQRDLNLPNSFVKFIATSELRNRIQSCTCCYFDLSYRLIKVYEDGHYLIRFLNDSQNVLHWYLYLNQTNQYCIAVAKPEFSEDSDGETLEDISTPTEIYYCASSFEEFIYRFWIENNIWFALKDGMSLTKEQQEYMNARVR